MFNLKTNWEKGSIALAKKFEHQGECENGRTDEQIVLYVFFAGS